MCVCESVMRMMYADVQVHTHMNLNHFIILIPIENRFDIDLNWIILRILDVATVCSGFSCVRCYNLTKVTTQIIVVNFHQLKWESNFHSLNTHFKHLFWIHSSCYLPRIYMYIPIQRTENLLEACGKHFYLHKISFGRIRLNFRLNLMRQLMEVRGKVFEVFSIPFFFFLFLMHVVRALAYRSGNANK